MLRIPIETGPRVTASAWIDVDLDAVAHNVRAFRRLLSPECTLIAVVKANAYGHGMVRTARTVLAAGARELAVATVAEGAQLRAAGITAPIQIAGPIVPDEAAATVQHGLVPSLGSLEVANALARAQRRYLPVQVEVDTGMARHGVPLGELGAFVAAVQQRGRLAISGVFTHFAGLDAAATPQLAEQLVAFCDATDAVRALRGTRRHVCNTLGALLLPAAHLDAVRIGGGLYGFDPLDGRGGLQLRPALALKARLVGVREVAAGAPVGYGGAFVCTRRSRLGLVPLGYADGLARELWHDASVLVRGRRAPIRGLVSMNQTIVDVTDVPGACLGDEVVLLGAQGDEVVRPAERVPPGGSVYEVTSLLRSSLPRRYLTAAGELAADGARAISR